MKDILSGALIQASRLIENTRQRPDFFEEFERAAEIIIDTLKKGRKILVAGNGGSAADAEHFTGELVCTFSKWRKGYSVLALTTNASVLTAWSNDKDFSSVFSRQIEAYGEADDVFLGISTSGNSENIRNAVSAAAEKQMKIILLLGRDGGKVFQMDLHHSALVVSSESTPRIQEIHTIVLHSFCVVVDKILP